jgi:deoxyribodipyrimidine photo-lyase
MKYQLVWFKRDLRVADHRPLVEAARRGPVLPLYIVEPTHLQPSLSPAAWKRALRAFDARLHWRCHFI